MLGTLCSHYPRQYIGTDVNENNEGCYESLGDFYRNKIDSENEYLMFNKRAEMIHTVPEFMGYKGKIDLIITSPPYFDKELYSESIRQSSKRYGDFNSWKTMFLHPTLETCFKYLSTNSYMIWNISDIKRGENDYIPLEQHTVELATMMGFDYIGKIGMVMSRMVGLDTSSIQNSWFDESTKMDYKIEPCFVFYKGFMSELKKDPIHNKRLHKIPMGM